MKFPNDNKCKVISLLAMKHSSISLTKDRATNKTESTQCEEKPKPPRFINQFNSSKQKAVFGPFSLKKPTRNQVINFANPSNKNGPLNIQRGTLASHQGNGGGLIPLLKLTSASIDNVSKLIANASSNSLLSTPQPEKNLAHSDSLSDVKVKLFKQLAHNEKQNSQKNLFNEQSVNLSPSPSVSTITSQPSQHVTVTKSASSRLLQKRVLDLDKDALQSKTIIITSEDLLLIENKLQDIITSIEEGFTISNECFEWWNFYFSSTIAGNYEEYFLNFSNKKKIGSYVNIELLCMMICYSLSFDYEAYQRQLKSMKTILSLLHFNLLLMIKLIMAIQRVQDYSYLKLEMMLRKSLTTIQEKDIDEYLITSLISHNMTTVTSLFQGIAAAEFKGMHERRLQTFLTYAYQNRDSIPVEEYNEFFRYNLVHVDNLEGSVLASSIKGANPIPIKIKVPYLPIMVHFKYTLVLDLDETLIHLKEDMANPENTKLFYRPKLFEFLQRMKNRFELVIFTVGTKKYADNILNAIESKEKFFDYRLYRHHATVIGNDFIKDLTKVGRDISRIIIVDNMPQNFRLQKENGIFIRPYFGENKNDTALSYLGELLYKIAGDNNDVRKSIAKYRNEIINQVTLNKITY